MHTATNSSADIITPPARWVTERIYAAMHGIARQTLTNWRWRDRQAGRDHAQPGYPQYRYFGSAVRYRIDSDAD